MRAETAPAAATTPIKVLKWVTYILVYGYVLKLIVAGGWGMFFAGLDFELLLDFDLPDGEAQGVTNTLSQYRFLRAVEFGLGVVLLYHHRRIFRDPAYNRLFLLVILGGVLARLLSLVVDGSPAPVFYVFLITELAGAAAAYAYPRRAGLLSA